VVEEFDGEEVMNTFTYYLGDEKVSVLLLISITTAQQVRLAERVGPTSQPKGDAATNKIFNFSLFVEDNFLLKLLFY
jgi:hypothetical protein